MRRYRLSNLPNRHDLSTAREAVLIYKEIAAIWNRLGRWMPIWPVAITVAASAWKSHLDHGLLQRVSFRCSV